MSSPCHCGCGQYVEGKFVPGHERYYLQGRRVWDPRLGDRDDPTACALTDNPVLWMLDSLLESGYGIGSSLERWKSMADYVEERLPLQELSHEGRGVPPPPPRPAGPRPSWSTRERWPYPDQKADHVRKPPHRWWNPLSW